MKLKAIYESIFRCILNKSLPLIQTLASESNIMNPTFITVKNKDNDEYVFLNNGNEYLSVYENYSDADNTSIEALENHVHLFENVKKKNQSAVRKITLAILKNLKRSLHEQYPNRKFVLYADFNFKDSVIIRFHQIWNNEDFYYNQEELKFEIESGKLVIYND